MSSPLSSKVGEEERARGAGRALGILGDAARGRAEAARRDTRGAGALGSAVVSAAKSGSAAASGAKAAEALFGGGALAMWSGAFGMTAGFAVEVRTRGAYTTFACGGSFLGTSSNGASSMNTLRLFASRASDLGGADATLRLAPGAPGAAPSGAASSL